MTHILIIMENGKPTDEGDDKGKEVNSTNSLFDRTNAATERLEDANKKTEELLNRQEELYAKQKLGGQSSAGQEPTPISEEDKKKEGATEFFKGTALGETIANG